jgi:hypothetical protein
VRCLRGHEKAKVHALSYQYLHLCW